MQYATMGTVEPRLSERYCECRNPRQKTVKFSAQPSNKWNAHVIFRLVRLIISQCSGEKRHTAGAILSAAHAVD